MKLKSENQSGHKMKALYRDRLHTTMRANVDERIHDDIKTRLFESKKRAQWWKMAIPVTALCLLIVSSLTFFSEDSQDTTTNELAMLRDVDQLTETTLEIDEELSSGQILAYEDYDLMVQTEYEF